VTGGGATQGTASYMVNKHLSDVWGTGRLLMRAQLSARPRCGAGATLRW